MGLVAGSQQFSVGTDGRFVPLRAYKTKRSTAPADESVEYHDVVFNKAFGDNKSPYQGWPDDKKDKLWEDMYSSWSNPYYPVEKRVSGSQKYKWE